MSLQPNPEMRLPCARVHRDTPRLDDLERLWLSRRGKKEKGKKRKSDRKAPSVRQLADALKELAPYDDCFAEARRKMEEMRLLGIDGADRMEAMRTRDRQLIERLSCIIKIAVYRAAGMEDVPAFKRAAAEVPAKSATFQGAWTKAQRYWASYLADSLPTPTFNRRVYRSWSIPIRASLRTFYPTDLQLFWLLPHALADRARHTYPTDERIREFECQLWLKLGAFLRYTRALKRHPPRRIFLKIRAIGERRP